MERELWNHIGKLKIGWQRDRRFPWTVLRHWSLFDCILYVYSCKGVHCIEITRTFKPVITVRCFSNFYSLKLSVLFSVDEDLKNTSCTNTAAEESPCVILCNCVHRPMHLLLCIVRNGARCSSSQQRSTSLAPQSTSSWLMARSSGGQMVYPQKTSGEFLDCILPQPVVNKITQFNHLIHDQCTHSIYNLYIALCMYYIQSDFSLLIGHVYVRLTFNFFVYVWTEWVEKFYITTNKGVCTK